MMLALIYFSESLSASLVFVISVLAILVIIKIYQFKNKLKNNSYDLIWFTFALGLLAVFYSGNFKWVIFFAAAQVITGNIFYGFAEHFGGKNKILITKENKSYSGLLFYFASSLIIIFWGTFQRQYIFLPKDFPFVNNEYYLLFVILLVAMSMTLFKMLSSGGFDNFINPLAGSVLAFIFLKDVNYSLLEGYFFGLFFAGIIAAFSLRVKFLTMNGSIATFLLAGFIFGLGGIKWSVPMLAFFILSSILSKLRKNVNNEVESYFEKSGVRDYMQVLANGGLGGLLVIFNSVFPNDVNYILYVSTLSAVCADTWATEIGTMRKTTTYNILNFKPVPQGISGGISARGTIGAFLGAIVISLSGLWWINFNIAYYLFLVIFAGVFGSFVDSVLGATVQAQNKCGVCSKITEKDIHCGVKSNFYSGFKWINNDFVNLFSGISGALFIILINFLIS